MRKRFLIPYAILILAMLFSAAYVYIYENRQADSFSAYCNIDFRGVREKKDEAAIAAVLAINDYTFLNITLKPECNLIIDGEETKLQALKALRENPSYSIMNYNKGNFLKYHNMAIYVFEKGVLDKIAAADKVEIEIAYENADRKVRLPLNEPDLAYWKKEIQ
jgi:hypothetical protein